MASVQEAVEVAFAYHRSGDFKTAASVYDQILSQLDRSDPNVLFGYGTLLVSQEKYGLGIALLQAAVAMCDSFAPIWTNLACAYKHIGRDEQALKAYLRALEIEPGSPDTLAGLAGFYINKGQPGPVIDYARKALAIDPNHDAAHMHLGLGFLEQGRHAEAWPHYEHRWETLERKKDQRPYQAPKWDGSFVNTLAIHGEQGLGDEILFLSCLQNAMARCERVIVECADRLVGTFKDSFPGVQFYPDHASLIQANGEPDAYISMGSLPGIVGLPSGKPFLKRHRAHKGLPRIGYAWKGGTLKTNAHDRSLERDMLEPIFAVQGVEYVSVQYGDGRSFEELQQTIADCDLVISVCQTAVHQAGAMGVDCWVLVPERAAWRYCGNDMRPWYNSVEFFRQYQGDWQIPIQEIAARLRGRYASLAA
jgi:tetratricopeptide (TPR) repeat protein